MSTPEPPLPPGAGPPPGWQPPSSPGPPGAPPGSPPRKGGLRGWHLALVGAGAGLFGLLLGVGIGLAAAGGDDDTAGPAVTTTTESETTEDDDAEGDDATTTTDEDAPTGGAADGSRENPLPLGTPVETGNGWSVIVNSVDLDAAERIQNENRFNEPAPAGSRYALVNLAVTNNGTEPGNPAFTIAVEMIGSQDRMWDGANAYCNAVIPEPMTNSGELFPGGSFVGNECRVVPEAEVADGSLVVAVSSVLGERVFISAS